MVGREAEPTMRALLARRELALRLADDEDRFAADALDRPTRWVHSSDLDDPTPFLAEDLVLLTTGTQFPADGAYPFEAYVRRLVERGVAALGFGTEVVRDGIPPGLTAACLEAGLPLFEVPYSTPFIAVARANAEAVAAQTYARRTWALSAQRALALAALRPDGLGATIAELARQLDTWVGMYDAAGELVREHPAGALSPGSTEVLHAEVGAVLRRGARAGSALRSDADAFTLQTLGRGGELRGVLAIAAGELDRAGRDVVTAVIAMAGLALEQHQRLSRARKALRSGMVRSLLTGDPALARQISRDVWGALPAAPVVVAVTDAAGSRSDALLELLELRAEERHGALFFGSVDDDVVVVVPASAAAVLEEFPERFGVRLGVSEPTPYAGFARAVDQARAARSRAAGPGVVRFAEVQAGGILSALSSGQAATVAAAYLDPLRAHDREHGARLEETVRAWVAADASNDAAAAALGVHRHTVRTRLAAAERLLGVDLSSFAGRAELWAALHLGG
ncbi:PucR family transcriptional regulator [Microbacterium sp. EYE_5]|uniref:PucR family transcriptional regulator n=1 Tax=unclassified Microbacterium TaxID=2609290 RepID=UPI002005DB60|nr:MULTISPECIES: PucR family transcriptional regulator [unclassified Microbacterium]MCK6080252.1 PucR family transcriptional regulator [Microbacterium sp. EYE_382]MCK6085523.1 PucR family transcriptional regulator [Microbacterium sp. EYE_384]MCK6122252.1 PucR family transcriptional regulator [Microbacterium sp. EYE_80]MCK6126286.1 PucR family transcriptional regulator [Microbacterium sp. EYE_79]MCK6141207.1 PucR family transcriptional regulator [Microbacterium sp. EYE_39]